MDWDYIYTNKIQQKIRIYALGIKAFLDKENGKNYLYYTSNRPNFFLNVQHENS